MLDSLGVAGALISLLYGGVLLHEGVSQWPANSSIGLLAGAGLFSFGLWTLVLVVANRWRRAAADREFRGDASAGRAAEHAPSSDKKRNVSHSRRRVRVRARRTASE